MELIGALYVRCRASEHRDRLRVYLDGETRPDFPEEVPAEEVDLVRLFEVVDWPDQILQPSSTELVALFEMVSGDPRYEIAQALPRFEPEQALWYETDGGDVDAYYCYEEGGFEFLLAPQSLYNEEDDKACNHKLSPQIENGVLQALDRGIISAITYLGRRLRGCREK